MTPLPKWVGWAGNVGAFASLCTTFGGMMPPKYGVSIAAIGAFLNSISHSLPGTGGKPQ